jgi:hypothetical protein
VLAIEEQHEEGRRNSDAALDEMPLAEAARRITFLLDLAERRDEGEQQSEPLCSRLSQTGSE